MTSVVIFQYSLHDYNAIAAMADTRFVAQGRQGNVERTSMESGIKLFSIPLKVARGYGYVKGRSPEYIINTSFGLGFAGNATIGLNFAGALSQICSFLECHELNCNTSLEAIAEFSARILTDWHRKYNQWGPWRQMCEVAIFGECPESSELQVFHLKPEFFDGVYVIKPSRFFLLDPVKLLIDNHLYDESCHPWLILGDRRPDIERLSKARVSDAIGVGTWTSSEFHKAICAPQYVLEAIVCEKHFKTIGDGVQILFVDNKGARPQRWIRPQGYDVPPEEYEWFSYLNYNLNDLGGIGNAEIGDPGGFQAAYVPLSEAEAVFSEFSLELDRIPKE